jgi:hypothetical protein
MMIWNATKLSHSAMFAKVFVGIVCALLDNCSVFATLRIDSVDDLHTTREPSHSAVFPNLIAVFTLDDFKDWLAH